MHRRSNIFSTISRGGTEKSSFMARITEPSKAISDLLNAEAGEIAFIAPPQLSTFERSAFPPPAFLNDNHMRLTPAHTLTRMPLLTATLRKQHRCFIASDTRFRAAARFLQGLWRTDARLPIGVHESFSGDKRKRIKLSSRLDPDAARAGGNFVSAQVHQLVRRELILREEGATIDVDRLMANTLSSAPLAFNLLGPLALDLDLATAVWRRLLPDFVQTVNGIAFEHSPGRGDIRFLGDGTAFDVALQVITPAGDTASVFIELKYSEGMSGPATSHTARHDDASRQVRLYHDPDSTALRSAALEQLWREHMLAQLTVDNRRTDKAIFVAIGPRLNRRVAAAFRNYTYQLADKQPEDEIRVEFHRITLEAVVESIAETKAIDLALKLWSRYLDFSRVLEHALNADSPS
jgi:hypothetical protein